MGADSVRGFFDELPARVAGKTQGINTSYLFDIDGAGQWLVDVRDDGVNVTEGGGSADCTIRASADNFAKLARGEGNPTTAYMSGKLKVDNVGAAMKLQKLF